LVEKKNNELARAALIIWNRATKQFSRNLFKPQFP